MAIKKKKKNYREILYELQKEAVTNNTGVSNDNLVKTATQETSNQLRTAYKPTTTQTTLNRTKYTAGRTAGVSSKKENKNLLEKAGYTVKNVGSGILSGLSGMFEAGTSEISSNLKKGKEEDKNFLGQLTDLFEATQYILNPMKGITESGLKTGIESIDIFKDKDKTALEKGTSIVNNATTNAFNSMPGKSLSDEYIQTVGKFLDDDADEKVMDWSNKVTKPVYDIQQDLYEEGQEYDKVTQVIGNTANVVGRMAPSIATTMLTKNPSAGMAVMGVSTKGSTTTEALNRGAELEEAVKIGNTKAIIEVGSEMLTGGINIFGKGALDDIVTKGIDKKVTNEVLNFLMKKGYGIVGEVGEETITDILNTWLDKGTVDPNATYSMEDFGDTAVVTILSTLVLNALGGGYSKTAYNQNVAEMQGKDVVDKVADKVDVVVSEDIRKQEDIAPTQEVQQVEEIEQEIEEVDEETQSKRRYYQYTPSETDSEITRTLNESASKVMNAATRPVKMRFEITNSELILSGSPSSIIRWLALLYSVLKKC